MILSKKWERLLFFETLKLTIAFLVSIFTVYLIIDFSIQSVKLFTYTKTGFLDIATYYFHNFIYYLHTFLSLAFLLASLKTISSMNIHNELTALFMGGISAKMISRPLFFLAAILSLFTYFSFESLLPQSLNYLSDFKQQHLKKHKKKLSKVNILYLSDNSRLAYQTYNFEKKELFDVFWIKSESEIWYAKYLKISNPPQGTFVEKILKDPKTHLYERKNSFTDFDFTNMHLEHNTEKALIPFENRSISDLFMHLISKKITSSKEKTVIVSQLNYKLALPLLYLLLIVSIFPLAIRFSRTFSTFFIYSMALFGFVLFLALMDSMLILAESQLFSATLLIWSPILLIMFIFGRKYLKT
ncbi:MAG: LptF/LptG family permease [Chlamydiae bacterium]|nr:LptF/LptG family permease [Chlamydiota bacterium]